MDLARTIPVELKDMNIAMLQYALNLEELIRCHLLVDILIREPNINSIASQLKYNN